MTGLELTDCLSPLFRVFRIPSEDRPGLVETYGARFMEFSKDELQNAINAHLEVSDRWPLPVDLLRRIPSFIADETIVARVFAHLRYQCETGPADYHPIHGSTPTMQRCNPKDLEILDQVGGVDRLISALQDKRIADKLYQDFAKAYSASIMPSQVRKIISEHHLAGPMSEKIDLVVKGKVKVKQIAAPNNGANELRG